MELDCGIAYRRIASWLDDELFLPRSGDGWAFDHVGCTCHISASPLPSRKLSTIDLERTLVRIKGEEHATDELYRLFTLRFISAGG